MVPIDQEEREEADRQRRETIRKRAEKAQRRAFDKEVARLRKRFPRVARAILESLAAKNLERAETG